MPLTVHGVGAGYYGRANRTRLRDRCEFCGGRFELANYDTWLCACALFVPIAPLSRLRIFRDCPGCRQHYRMPMRQVRREAKAVLDGAVEALRRDPATREEPLQAAWTLFELGRLADVDRLMNALLEHHADDLDVLLAQGAMLQQRGRAEQALAYHQRAAGGFPDSPAAHDALGECLLELGRRDAGMASLQRAAELAPQALDVRERLVEEHQRRQDWPAMVGVLEQMATIEPSLLGREAFARLLSRARRAIGQPG